MPRLAAPIRKLIGRSEPLRRIGPFSLVEPIGRGGFAPVWLASETYGTTVLRTAAVKLFSLEAPAIGGAPMSGMVLKRERVLEEARALCRVEHPNVVRFYSISVDEDAGVMALAMEHVAGTALDARLRSKGRLAVRETLDVGVAIASALAAVHHAGLVHRDVKPANVVESAGVVKLIDFGIASADVFRSAAANSDDAPPSSSGSALDLTLSLGARSGTIGYIDPVCVARGAPATAASDLYALGAMLFKCLAGCLPASVDDDGALDPRVLDGRRAAPSLGVVADDAPEPLVRLVDGLLAPDRAARPSSGEHVAQRLEQIRREIAGRARPLPCESIGPFRGLGRFEVGDRDVYFGRTGEIAAAVEMLRGRGLALLVGASGSGKSSLARAGVLPAVLDGALGAWPKRWDAAIAVPTWPSIVEALEPYIPGVGSMQPEAIVQKLVRRAEENERGLCLLVDQLEELATVADARDRAFTSALLAGIGRQPLPGLRAVVTARRDLFDGLLSQSDLARVLVRGSVLIEPLGDAAWAEVVDQGLAAYGHNFEDDALRASVLGELKGKTSAMPLVQFALTQLWFKRDVARKLVTREAVTALGGIAGALERHADATLAELAEELPGSERAARRMLVALTTAHGTRAVRSEAGLLKIGGDHAREALDALETARLVVSEPGGLTLAHEALLTGWGQLEGWLAEEREDRLLADEIESHARAWRADTEGVPVWRRRKLERAEDLARRGASDLSEHGVAFLRAGRNAERKRFVYVAVAIAAVLGSLGGLAVERVHSAATAAQQEKKRADDADILRARAEQSQRDAEKARLDETAAKVELERKNERIREMVLAEAEREKNPALMKVADRIGATIRESPSAAPSTSTSVAVAPRPQPDPTPSGTVKPTTTWVE